MPACNPATLGPEPASVANRPRLEHDVVPSMTAPQDRSALPVRHRQSGFTLIEIVIVVVVVGLLLGGVLAGVAAIFIPYHWALYLLGGGAIFAAWPIGERMWSDTSEPQPVLELVGRHDREHAVAG